MKNLVSGKTNTVAVAVLDENFDEEHEFLSGRLLPSINCTTSISNNAIHGTHTVGTVVDCTPNNVKILPVKIKMTGTLNTASTVAVGIEQAVNAGVKVINLSLGWSPNVVFPNEIEQLQIYEQNIIDAIDYANTNDVVIVVSAGNDGNDTEDYFPAKLGNDDNYPNVITVAAVDEYDLPMDLPSNASAIGEEVFMTNFGNAVDVCAPGEKIVSSVPLSCSVDMKDGVADGYGLMSGTSMAAPHVSAAVAMLALEYPSATATELKTMIKSMTVDLGVPGWDPVFGEGRIDFRMLNHSGLPTVVPVPVTDLELIKIENDVALPLDFQGITYTENISITDCCTFATRVFPKEATDKSVTYTTDHSNIIEMNFGRLRPLATGTVILKACTQDVSSQNAIIHVDTENASTPIPLSLNVASTTNTSADDKGDFFVFTPTTSGYYIFYSSSTINTYGELYTNSEGLIAQNNNISSYQFDFAIPRYLVANQTYYLKVTSAPGTLPNTCRIYVVKSYNTFTINSSLNQDARCIQFSVKTASVADSLHVTIGSQTYVLPKSSANSTSFDVLDARFIITLTNNFSENSITWQIKASIPAPTIGTNTIIRARVNYGGIVLHSGLGNKQIIAYGSSYKTHLTPGTTVSALLDSMETDGYTFTAYTWDDERINSITTTKVATGIKIVQCNSYGKIVHVYYLVLYGDVGGER